MTVLIFFTGFAIILGAAVLSHISLIGLLMAYLLGCLIGAFMTAVMLD